MVAQNLTIKRTMNATTESRAVARMLGRFNNSTITKASQQRASRSVQIPEIYNNPDYTNRTCDALIL